MRSLITASVFLVTAGAAASQETPVLTIYTYDSFVAEWGPGPAVEAAFEEECACDLQFVAAGDGAALLSRLRLEGARTEADIVLGLDSNLIAAASETDLFAPHEIDGLAFDMPVAWEDPVFLPYDWGYFAFVHETGELTDVPTSFEALAESDHRIIIQDPRSSTPGLGLLLWVQTAYGDRAGEIWDGLSDNIVTVTQGWTEAYGLFLDGEADMVLSYTTSPAYHLIAEDDPGKAAAIFEEGHYMQVEIAGMVASSDVPELARDFLRFMVSDAFQSVIPTTNWMYPARLPSGGLPDGFDRLARPGTALLLPPQEVPEAREAALASWLEALSG